MSIALLLNPPVLVKLAPNGDLKKAASPPGVLDSITGGIEDIMTGGDENNTVIFDASLEESHKMSVRVTRHPIEDGSMISDHAITNPDILTIRGEITESPIAWLGGILPAIAGGGFGNIGGGLSALSSFSGELPPHIERFAVLEKHMKEHTAVDIVTGFKYYESMMITDLSVPKNIDSGRSVEFSITLEKVNIVKSDAVANIPDDVKASYNIGAISPPSVNIEEAIVSIAWLTLYVSGIAMDIAGLPPLDIPVGF